MNWHTVLSYDPDSGILHWRNRDASQFKSQQAFNAWNTKYANTVAGSKSYMKKRNGVPRAITMRIGDVNYYAHRIIWEMLFGPIPKGKVIDHVDGNPFNNRLCNLRLATPSENLYNRGKQRNSTSGFKGVFRNKKNGGWLARIRFRNHLKHLGTFSSKEEAASAYAKASLRYHGRFGRTEQNDMQEIAFEAFEKKTTHFQEANAGAK